MKPYDLGNGVRLFLGPFSGKQESELSLIRNSLRDEACHYCVFHFNGRLQVVRSSNDAEPLPGEDFGWDTEAGTFESYLPGYRGPSGNERVLNYSREKFFELLHRLGATDVPSTSDLERFETQLLAVQDRDEMHLRDLARIFKQA